MWKEQRDRDPIPSRVFLSSVDLEAPGCSVAIPVCRILSSWTLSATHPASILLRSVSAIAGLRKRGFCSGSPLNALTVPALHPPIECRCVPKTPLEGDQHPVIPTGQVPRAFTGALVSDQALGYLCGLGAASRTTSLACGKHMGAETKMTSLYNKPDCLSGQSNTHTQRMHRTPNLSGLACPIPPGMQIDTRLGISTSRRRNNKQDAVMS